MRSVLLCGILGSFLLCTIAIAENGGKREAPGLISGTIREAETGTPLPGTIVTLSHPSEICPMKKAITDLQGSFYFSDLPIGRYKVEVQKTGFQKLIYGQTMDAPNGIEIILSPSEDQEYIEIQLASGSAAGGHVYDENGSPVREGFVFLIPTDGMSRSYLERTDDTGYYWVEGVPPGFYKMMVRQYSATDEVMIGTPWYYPGTLQEEKSTPLWLESGKPASVDVYFPKDTRPFWKARVLGPDGQGIGKAEITILQANGNRLSYQLACRTASSGECEVRNLSPGDYWAYVNKVPPPFAGWINREKINATTPLEKYALPFRITENESTETEFRLSIGKTATVRYLKQDGSPALDSGLNLILEHQFNVLNRTFGFTLSNTETRSESELIYGLAPGFDYKIRFENDDPELNQCVVSVNLNGEPITDATLRVEDGEVPVLDVWLGDSAVITGTASSELRMVFAEPTEAGAAKQLYRQPFHSPVEQGRFLLRGLPPGNYNIRGNGRSIAPVNVTVAAGETKVITLK